VILLPSFGGEGRTISTRNNALSIINSWRKEAYLYSPEYLNNSVDGQKESILLLKISALCFYVLKRRRRMTERAPSWRVGKKGREERSTPRKVKKNRKYSPEAPVKKHHFKSTRDQ
jgi:hypothetical protein